MSATEFKTMSETGRVVEGAGGRTYVVNPANPGSFTGAGRGSPIYSGEGFRVRSCLLPPPAWKPGQCEIAANSPGRLMF